MVAHIFVAVFALVMCCCDIKEAITSFKNNNPGKGTLDIICAVLMMLLFFLHASALACGEWDIHFHFNHSTTRMIR